MTRKPAPTVVTLCRGLTRELEVFRLSLMYLADGQDGILYDIYLCIDVMPRMKEPHRAFGGVSTLHSDTLRIAQCMRE